MKKRCGAGLTEYALLCALIGAVSIGALSLTGTNVKCLFQTVANDIEGASAAPCADASPTTPPTAQKVALVNTNGALQWADGKQASTCNEYRNPSDSTTYNAATENGQYILKDIGPVECDMQYNNGGWTLIGQFNQDDDASVTMGAQARNSIPYKEVLILDNNDDSAPIKQVMCHTTPHTGFAADNTAGYNCTADSTISIRVLQGLGDDYYFSWGGNYGIYISTSLANSGGCNWGSDTRVWGRHYDGGHCHAKGDGEAYISYTSWGSDFYYMYVR